MPFCAKNYGIFEKNCAKIDVFCANACMIKNILLNVGYGVEAVLDATEALVKLKLNHYDLIITDLEMPKINGYKFIEILQNDEMYTDIPVIVMSSKPKEQALHDLRKQKIEGYMQKDMFNQAEFVSMVKETLSKYHE